MYLLYANVPESSTVSGALVAHHAICRGGIGNEDARGSRNAQQRAGRRDEIASLQRRGGGRNDTEEPYGRALLPLLALPLTIFSISLSKFVIGNSHFGLLAVYN